MRHLRRTTLLAIAGLALAACDAGVPRASVAEPTEPGETATIPAASPATAEPIPSDELAGFTCDLPIVDGGSVAIANIVDVRAGSHDGFDRVVFEFEQGTPALTLDSAEPPFSHDASGEPINVDGSAFLRLTMRGGTRQTDAGDSS